MHTKLKIISGVDLKQVESDVNTFLDECADPKFTVYKTCQAVYQQSTNVLYHVVYIHYVPTSQEKIGSSATTTVAPVPSQSLLKGEDTLKLE